jgi:hypothetical protein
MGIVAVYDTLYDATCAVPAGNIAEADRHVRTDPTFYGGSSVADIIKTIRRGDAEAAEKMGRFIDNHSPVNIQTLGPKWDLDVSGAYPIVPIYCSGDPMHMRVLRESEHSLAPIKVYVSTSVSAGVKREQILNRGAALATFCQALALSRPVDLYVYAENDLPREQRPNSNSAENYRFDIVHIGLAPFDLPQIAACLGNPVFDRGLSFTLRGFSGGAIGWPWGDHYILSDPIKYRERIAPILGLSDEDLVFGGMSSEDDLLRKPAEWLKRALKAYGLTED